MPIFVTSDGVRLHYDDEGRGRAVVLVAGFKATATSWLFQRQHLLSRGYRVLALDRRGHGRSDDPPWGARMARHGRDLAEFLEATTSRTVGASPHAVLVGGSMGASTIWACLDLGYGDLVRGVVGIDQTPKMSNEDGWSCGFYGYGAHNLGTYFSTGAPPTGRGTPLERRGERVTRMAAAFAAADPDDQAGRGNPDRQRAPSALSVTDLALLRDHAVQDWRDVVTRATVPALYVAGRDSELWPCEHAEATASLNPLARAVVIDDCGHAANVEQPDAFNDALDDFLARVD